VGRRIRQASGSTERSRQEEERRHEDGVESQPCTQASAGSPRPDEEVGSLTVPVTQGWNSLILDSCHNCAFILLTVR